MSAEVELSTSFDEITGFCVAERIWRSRMASNWRLASAIFCWSVRVVLPANRSGGTSAALTALEREETSISAEDQLGLQSAGLFHGFENRHHVTRGDAQAVQRRGHFLDRGQLRQTDQ